LDERLCFGVEPVMIYSLLSMAFLMGLGGIPHCATMCASPCAVAMPQGLPWSALLGRTLGYALLGAVAAGAASSLSIWSRWVGVLQPVWVMLLAAAVMLGIWMALRGAMPAWVQEQGLRTYHRVQSALADSALLTRWPWLGKLLPMVLGMAWAALPCGLLYGAVMVATLAPGAFEGAAVMVCFSLPGAVALWWLPRRFNVWRFAGPQATPNAVGVQAYAVVPVLWLGKAADKAADGLQQEPQAAASAPKATDTAGPVQASGSWAWLSDPRWAVRVSGAMLAAAAAWALAHRLMEQWQAWCAT
jgi:uncharacterized protein